MITPASLLSVARQVLPPTRDAVLDEMFDTYADNGWSNRYDSPLYYRFLYRLSQAFPGLTMVELGAREARASLHFLKGGGAKVVGIDINCIHDPKHVAGFNYVPLSYASTSEQALASVDELVDIVFIDTDHTYETTAKEFELWRPKVKPGGLILFDDIGAPEYGCTKFWRELKGEKLELPELHPLDWGFGVWFA